MLAGHATATPKAHDGIIESIRVLLIAHESTKQAMQRIHGRLRSLTVTAPDPLRIDLANLTAPARAAKAARLRPGDDPADIATATRTTLRVLGRQHQMLNGHHLIP